MTIHAAFVAFYPTDAKLPPVIDMIAKAGRVNRKHLVRWKHLSFARDHGTTRLEHQYGGTLEVDWTKHKTKNQCRFDVTAVRRISPSA